MNHINPINRKVTRFEEGQFVILAISKVVLDVSQAFAQSQWDGSRVRKYDL
jgi:hypothetical protein